MFDSVESLERKIKKIEDEIKTFRKEMSKGSNREFYKLKIEGAKNQLSKVRSKLVLEKAKAALKAKKKK